MGFHLVLQPCSVALAVGLGKACRQGGIEGWPGAGVGGEPTPKHIAGSSGIATSDPTIPKHWVTAALAFPRIGLAILGDVKLSWLGAQAGRDSARKAMGED